MPGRDREFTMRFLAGAENRNVYGNVHGGSMMKWMDEGAGACAAGWIQCIGIAGLPALIFVSADDRLPLSGSDGLSQGKRCARIGGSPG